jgi:hypothetical protein
MNTALSTVTTGTNPSNASGWIGEVKQYFKIHKERGCASCAPALDAKSRGWQCIKIALPLTSSAKINRRYMASHKILPCIWRSSILQRARPEGPRVQTRGCNTSYCRTRGPGMYQLPYLLTTPRSWGVEEFGKKGEDKRPNITLTYPMAHTTN